MLSELWFLLVVIGLPFGAFYLWLHLTVKRREQRYNRPFKDMPRPAGWSLQQRSAALMDSFSENLMLCMLMGMTCWAIWLSNRQLLWFALPVGLGMCTFFCLRARHAVTHYANHRLGLQGEQVVGQILDRLCSDKIHVFHDLEIIEPGKKPWNIDHVVVTEGGVFAIETKTRRKPKDLQSGKQNGHKVTYDGQRLIFPTPMKADHQSVAQAESAATWLATKLSAHTGFPIPVKPVLVLPGWWVEAKAREPVAVLNPKGLAPYLNRHPALLPPEQISAIQSQLEERCRIDLTR